MPIYDMSGWQEMSVNAAAERAAPEILRAGLGVEGHVPEWIDCASIIGQRVWGKETYP